MRVRGFLCGGVRMRRLRGNPLFVGGRDGISALIFEGDLPGSLVISPHGTTRPHPLDRVPLVPSGSADPALRVSDFPHSSGTRLDECGRCSDEVDIQGVDLFLGTPQMRQGFSSL